MQARRKPPALGMEQYLGTDARGLDYYLVGGQVYSRGERTRWVCTLTAYKWLL